jgi:hypothetical protein
MHHLPPPASLLQSFLASSFRLKLAICEHRHNKNGHDIVEAWGEERVHDIPSYHSSRMRNVYKFTYTAQKLREESLCYDYREENSSRLRKQPEPL